MRQYSGVVARIIRENERLVTTIEKQTPLVIEPEHATDTESLQAFLASNSLEILSDIACHGAVLLRGFNVNSESDFEKIVLSIRGMRGIDHVIMSEAGRTTVNNTRFVLHTNANYKTGGTLGLGGFHNENYYLPDVPRYISFLCIQPSWLGGETGLVDCAALYRDLPDTLKSKLERRNFKVSSWPISEVATRYTLSHEQVEQFCSNAGLSVIAGDGQRLIVMSKPSVIENPTTKERALLINFSAELDRHGLKQALYRAFHADYLGWRWTIHRLTWRFDWIMRIQPRRPFWTLRRSFGFAWRSIVKPTKGRHHRGMETTPLEARVGDAFTGDEIETLAVTIRKHYSSFKWKSGDVLLIDNLKMAHAGMPGFGPRLLRALISNPIKLPCSPGGAGLYILDENDLCETLGAQIVRGSEIPPSQFSHLHL